jgi:hypothetical protein
MAAAELQKSMRPSRLDNQATLSVTAPSFLTAIVVVHYRPAKLRSLGGGTTTRNSRYVKITSQLAG